MLNGKTHYKWYKWPFSIAMFNYQRVDSLVQVHTIYGSAACSNMETIHETCCGENNPYVMQKVEIFRIPTSITSYHYNIP